MAPVPPASKPAAPILDMDLAPSLRLIDKYPPSLKGRTVGVLVTDGADGKVVDAVVDAVQAAGATVQIVAPKVGGVSLKGGKKCPADGQLAGMPSVLFDAVALVVSTAGCAELLNDSAAIDFVSNAFIHLKAIGMTAEAQALLEKGNVQKDAGVVDIGADAAPFVKAAATRQWDREPKVRPAP
jgi:catalase